MYTCCLARYSKMNTVHGIRARLDSPAGTRTRVFRVRAEYPDQLDYRGWMSKLSFPQTMNASNLTYLSTTTIFLPVTYDMRMRDTTPI